MIYELVVWLIDPLVSRIWLSSSVKQLMLLMLWSVPHVLALRTAIGPVSTPQFATSVIVACLVRIHFRAASQNRLFKLHPPAPSRAATGPNPQESNRSRICRGAQVVVRSSFDDVNAVRMLGGYAIALEGGLSIVSRESGRRYRCGR